VYNGTGKSNFKTRKEFSGSILKQADDVHEYLQLNNNLNSSFNGLQRQDFPDYPEHALREALLNAIVHRDYDYSGSTIINVFDNRIEFVSLGGLVKGITMEDILGGVSQPRNMIIAAIFYRIELIEAYGTGIQRMIEGYGLGLQKPGFRAAPASFAVTLPKMDYMLAEMKNEAVSREALVLRLLKEKGMITRKDVELVIHQSKFPAIQLLNKLLADGLIMKTGAARNVKYCLKEGSHSENNN
jgi:ATP-dependent DNA helicase RecG